MQDYEKKMKKKTLLRMVMNKVLSDSVLGNDIQHINLHYSVTLWFSCSLN